MCGNRHFLFSDGRSPCPLRRTFFLTLIPGFAARSRLGWPFLASWPVAAFQKSLAVERIVPRLPGKNRNSPPRRMRRFLPGRPSRRWRGWRWRANWRASPRPIVLLRKAIEQSPGDAYARWQSCQILEDKDWRTIDEVVRAARQDERLHQCGNSRDAATERGSRTRPLWPGGAANTNFTTRERVHWMRVLAVQPDNAEAIKALDLRAFQGMLLTPARSPECKATDLEMRKAVIAWSPVVMEWPRPWTTRTRRSCEDRRRRSVDPRTGQAACLGLCHPPESRRRRTSIARPINR